ncbi:MAG: hypothetical protein H0V82_12860 [Candidatus Protochlamydia sp.]|nr:hypothetical protein [Candidatus Protochlamydia sp.]
MQMAITGIGVASVNFSEYNSYNALQKYTDLIIPIKNVFQKAPSSLSANDYNIIIGQVAQLKLLAEQGVDDTNGTQTFKSFMNEDMAAQLDDIMRTLAVVGIPPDPAAAPLSNGEKIGTLMAWQNLSQFQIDVLKSLNKALSFLPNAYQYTVDVTNPGTGAVTKLNVLGSPSQTLQSLLEVEFVGAGNQQMSGKMSLLEEALELSRRVLTSLTAVQNLANQIQVNNPIPEYALPLNYTMVTNTNPITGVVTTTKSFLGLIEYRKAYKASASAYFTQIFPSAVPLANTAEKLLKTKQDLWNQMLELEAANAGNVDPITGLPAPVDRNTKGSLANAVYLVVKDISAAFNGLTTSDPQLQQKLIDGVKTWIIDNQNLKIDDTAGVNKGGQIQDRISSALSAAENLEEGQRENVRRFLFVFQQFYKSAAAMLTLLGQLFEKINRGIER